MKKEVWIDVAEYDGLYQISNAGNVRSLYKRGTNGENGRKISTDYTHLKPVDVGNGYFRVTLVKNGINKMFYVHRLVANYFVANPFLHNVINHKDGNKKNNFYKNLEWCTYKQNANHAVANHLIAHHRYGLIDENGKIITIFNTRNEICGFLKREIYQEQITRACNGINKTAYGCRWKYID